MYLPATISEIKKLGWDKPDIIFVSGDTYIDSPYIGISLLGKFLTAKGFKVAIIAQPDLSNDKDISIFGEPALFWGVTAGSVDSMVSNYTALKKKRKSDDFTPGGINNLRPDRASLIYTNHIRRYFKDTKPIILGGIEASLRRVAHYDYWSDKLRKSVLLDAKADYLVYGMGEKTVLEIAENLRDGKPINNIRGLCYLSNQPQDGFIELPEWNGINSSKNSFIKMFNIFYRNNDPLISKGLYQKYDNRYVIQNPPQFYLTQKELDEIHSLEFERDVHPFYAKNGKVKALDTIQFSILTHRGCYGECNFCAITVHQGKTIQSRSESSILSEAAEISKHKDFKGIISDVGGPTANMYGFECDKKLEHGSCIKKRCVFPQTCEKLEPDHSKQIDLLKKLRNTKGIRKIFVASGLRYDLIENDRIYGDEYLRELVEHHVSGQLKIAPEHSDSKILSLMGKPEIDSIFSFRDKFNKYSAHAGKNQFLTYYFIAAHPGCTEEDMKKLKNLSSEKLKINPEQIQIFTPTPSTYSTLMYYTETNPFTGEKLFVEKTHSGKENQKDILMHKPKTYLSSKKYRNGK